ncbi:MULTISPECIES: heavy metal-responsive transcriptional regulator [unclassified Streptomyces]|uniref:heavy metal-responsive transcriptional regulator n=1 Tax=unclassified Streptomyces TaxID=2593676 RepID=UPI0035D5E787
MTTYRISQLAERSGVPATTLRFYETAGLLPAERTASGYRVYGEAAVDRLAFISSAKLLGLALEEIRDLLDVREEGVCASVRDRMLPLVAGRIAETDGRIAELRAFSTHLAGVHDQLSPGAGGRVRPGLPLHHDQRPGGRAGAGDALADPPPARPGARGTAGCPGGLHAGRRRPRRAHRAVAHARRQGRAA